VHSVFSYLCRIKPEWPRGYQRKGTALYYLEKLDEAVTTYQEGLKYDPNNAELQKNIKEVEGKQAKDTNMMMQTYMKLLNNPETKELMSDPTFLPILQAIMSNPTEAFKYMGDPRVQKILQVLQGSMSPAQAQQAEEFMKKQGKAQANPAGSSSEEETMKEESYAAASPPPPKKEQPKPEKMDIEDPAEQAKARGNDQFKKKNFNEALNHYE
jgi:stress-induced-phosphoprotein 1